jgi:lysophospholipase L1-like esterase
VLALLAAEAAVRVAMPHWREFWSGWFITTDRVDGTVVAIGRPGYDGMFAQNNGDFRVRIRINDLGLRDDVPGTAANGQVWAVGDSMTFGWGVEADQTYAKVAEHALGRGVYSVASPGADVIGYESLVKRMPAGVRPAAVIVGLVLENDLADYAAARQPATPTPAAENPPASEPLSDRLKILLTERSALYNFFAVALKRSDVITNFLVSVGLIQQAQSYSHNLDGADLDAETASTADELQNLQHLLPDGTPFAVLVVPGRFEVRDGDARFHAAREKMLAALKAHGIAAIDVFDAFKAAGFAATHFAHDGHWNARGHDIAGRAVADWLRGQGLAH